MAINSYCLADLPPSGLGNKLLVWARARVFARKHGLPLAVRGWMQFRQTALHHRGDLRMYWGYFSDPHEVPAVTRCVASLSARVVDEPALEQTVEPRDCIYRFTRVPKWEDYFAGLREHRETIVRDFRAMLTPRWKQRIETLPAHAVCAHLRFGDQTKAFAQIGHGAEQIEFVRSVRQSLVALAGREVPVVICSDGTPTQLQPLLALPGVSQMPEHAPLEDLALLMRSRVLVLPGGSTFGQWAAFLGSSVCLRNRPHTPSDIRPGAKDEYRIDAEAPWTEETRLALRRAIV